MTTTQKIITTTLVLVIAAMLFYALTPKSATTPPPPLTNTNFDGSTSQIEDVVFSGREPQFPTQLPPLQVTDSTHSAQFLPAMIGEYQLRPVETGYWESDLATMTFDSLANTYTVTTNIQRDASKKIDLNAAITTINTFLAQHSLQSTLQPDKSAAQFFAGEYELASSPPSLAEYVQIPYSRQFNQIPIIDGQRVDQSMVFLVDGLNQIKKITFHPFLPEYQPLDEKPLIPISEAIGNINQGQGSIISVAGEATFPDFSQIKSGEMNSVILEYRVDGTTNAALPYYHFSGTGTNQAGETLQLHIITPAITLN